MTSEWDNITNICNNKKAIEIGGPTQLFWDNTMLPLYHKFRDIDNINKTLFDVFENITDTEHSKIFKTNFNMDGTDIDFNKINQLYDIVVSSHTLEHIANPIKFLKDVQKLLIEDGIILSILPIGS